MREQGRKRIGRPPASNVDISTSDLILQEASRLFVKFGYDGVSVEEVAKAADVTKAVVYYYFSSKTDLFLKSVIHVIEVSRERTLAILNQDGQLYDRLLQLMRIRLHIDATLDLHAIMHGSQNALTMEQVEEIQQAERRLFETIADSFRVAMEEGKIRKIDPDLASRVYMSLLIIGKSEQERLGIDSVSIDSMAGQLLDFMWTGIELR